MVCICVRVRVCVCTYIYVVRFAVPQKHGLIRELSAQTATRAVGIP